MVTRSHIAVEMLGSGFFPLARGSCTREIEINSGASLFRLAEAILAAFGFDLDHAFGYYDNLDDHYDSTDVHTSFADFLDDTDPDHGKSVKKTRVSAVFSPGTRRLFLFDYGDEWHFLLTCLDTGRPGRAGQPAKVVASKGKAPPQYPEEEDYD